MSITLEQFEALKPGDKVRIIKIDDGRPNYWNSFGDMDKYAGQVVTIYGVHGYGFIIKEDKGWSWRYTDIDSIVIKDGKQDWVDSYAYFMSRGLTGHLHKPAEKPLIQIDKVIFNDPATIVFWKDGTKTVVKAGEDEYFDKEKGLAMAISKKVLGNKGNYFNTFKKHDAINDNEEVYIPLSILKEYTSLKKLKELIALMEG